MDASKGALLAAWTQKAKKNAGRLIFSGVLAVIAGILCVTRPLMGGLSVTLVVGFMLVVGGIARTLHVFSADSFGQGLLALVGGVLTLLAGIVTIAMPGLGLMTLTMLLGIWLLVDGLAGAMLAFKVRPASGWGWMLTSAILAGLLGILLLVHWPFSGLVAIGTLVGINLLVSGFTMISIGSSVRRLASKAA